MGWFMTRSMTGFARVTGQAGAGALAIEIRTVNHRYLEVSLRVPEPLRFAEPWLREEARRRLARGKVDIALRWQRDTAAAGTIRVDEQRLQGLRVALQKVAATIPDSRPPETTTLLGWPGVMEEPELDERALNQEMQALFRQALEDLQAHREREGAELATLIDQRLTEIEQIVSVLQTGQDELQALLSARLQERLERLQAEVEPERLQQEVVMLLQKSDVAEELDRLSAHVVEARKVLQRREPIGRRLDFLMQEFNREANTLASKASQTAFTQAAIDLKVLIEQMREQIQNIE